MISLLSCLCCFNTGIHCSMFPKRQQQHYGRSRLSFITLLLLLVCYALTADFNWDGNNDDGNEQFGLHTLQGKLISRLTVLPSVLQRNDKEVTDFPILITIKQKTRLPIHFFHDRLPAIHVDSAAAAEHDFGGLHLESIRHDDSSSDSRSDSSSSAWGRSIRGDDYDAREDEMAAQYRAYELDMDEESHWGYNDDMVDPAARHSVKSRAIYEMKPNCNTFHEQSWGGDDRTTTIRYLASGYYRDSYLLTHPDFYHSNNNDNNIRDLVVKRQRLARPISRARLERVRNEALAMERLTSSPRITTPYGHCAFALVVEPAPGSMADWIVPYHSAFQNYPGVLPQQTLNYRDNDPVDKDGGFNNGDVRPLNNLTALEKLNVALALAESLADIHGLDTGPLVLGDVALDQWLVAPDGRIVLNDFDNSVFLGWRMDEERYSSFLGNHVGGFKAPEEVILDPGAEGKFTESTDLWKVGDLLYSILTGLQPYYDELHHGRKDLIDAKLLAGTPPYLDPRYRHRSFVEGRIVDIMDRCFRLRPEDRVDIFEVVRWLRETKQLLHEKHESTDAAAEPEQEGRDLDRNQREFIREEKGLLDWEQEPEQERKDESAQEEEQHPQEQEESQREELDPQHRRRRLGSRRVRWSWMAG